MAVFWHLKSTQIGAVCRTEPIKQMLSS